MFVINRASLARLATFGILILAFVGNGETTGSVALAKMVVSAVGGSDCATEIERFQAIVSSDHETGNVAGTVYRQIEDDLSRASVACAAGKTAQAHAIVAASKARHGYRA